MKINIRKDMARFIVNEEKGKVICILEDTEDLFLVFAEQNLPLSPVCDTLDMTDSELYKYLLMPKRFVGIATCDPEDEFSVETGKLIAFSNAKDNLQNSFFKRANFYVNTIDTWLNKAVENINGYGAKIAKNTLRRHNKIAEILGEKEE
jgi:hypothetical protein